MKRVLLETLQLSIGFLIILYVGDWGILRARMARQTAFQTVQVQQFLATPLKGQKEEFDYLGVADETCVRSIFPHASYDPCWWMKRHTTEWER